VFELPGEGVEDTQSCYIFPYSFGASDASILAPSLSYSLIWRLRGNPLLYIYMIRHCIVQQIPEIQNGSLSVRDTNCSSHVSRQQLFLLVSVGVPWNPVQKRTGCSFVAFDIWKIFFPNVWTFWVRHLPYPQSNVSWLAWLNPLPRPVWRLHGRWACTVTARTLVISSAETSNGRAFLWQRRLGRQFLLLPAITRLDEERRRIGRRVNHAGVGRRRPPLGGAGSKR